ncbi:MAG: hypothetical protein M5U19_18015 [Microthrixaceae bacterium]|nr:hypothetical protein [Microthrixaceae bacterium]
MRRTQLGQHRLVGTGREHRPVLGLRCSKQQVPSVELHSGEQAGLDQVAHRRSGRRHPPAVGCGIEVRPVAHPAHHRRILGALYVGGGGEQRAHQATAATIVCATKAMA